MQAKRVDPMAFGSIKMRQIATIGEWEAYGWASKWEKAEIEIDLKAIVPPAEQQPHIRANTGTNQQAGE
jgi:hypothetical protein